MSGPESEGRAQAGEGIAAAFEDSGGAYGYGRVRAATGVAGRGVRGGVMREEGLVAAGRKRRRRYGSYDGEVSEAPERACLKGDGTHGFDAGAPDEPWITDIAEFGTKAGKACPSPMVDRLDGMPLSRSISTSPNAELASSPLSGACALLAEGDHPRARNDRGCHYRWPGWISMCDEHGLVRSMPRKGHSPDDSRMEGFFGRPRIEFFYGRDWEDVALDEFTAMLDACLTWHRDERLKSDLGYVSPREYRKSPGLAAQMIDSNIPPQSLRTTF